MLTCSRGQASARRLSSCGAELASPYSRHCAAAKRWTPCNAVKDQSSSIDSSASLQQLKQRVKEVARTKYGHDLDDSTRQQLQALADQLSKLSPTSAPAEMPLTGTKWSLLYTTSSGTSSGKVGPFIANVEQVFPADAPGQYINLSRVGLVEANLAGDYSTGAPDKINLEFRELSVGVGPLKFSRPFEKGQMMGFWRTVFADADMRVFYTNKGNLFIMSRLQN